MPTLAFSTLACPNWKIDRVMRTAVACGYQGVELRSAGYGVSDIMSDPAQSAASKVFETAQSRGVTIAAIATNLVFDQPISPPVIGTVIGDQERTIRQAKRMIDLASALECPLVRVFAFRRSGNESVTRTTKRVCSRLAKVADHADKTGVRIAIENGGDYLTASAMMGILDRVQSPLLCASYSPAIALRGGESPDTGVDILGNRLAVLKIREIGNGSPVMPDLNAGPWKSALNSIPDNAWIVVEHDSVHFATEETEVERVLTDAASSIRSALLKTNALTA